MTTKTAKKTTTRKTARKATPKKKAPAKTPAKAATAATVAKGKPKSSTEAKGAKAATRGKQTPKTAKATKKPSGLNLAAKVLAESKEPLAAKAITERVLAAGWKTNGKTPHATLYAAIIREIKSKGEAARFRKTDRGLFAAGKEA